MTSSLQADYYQYTMAYAYWRTGRASQGAVFHLYFRQLPFAGGYAVSAGLSSVIDFLSGYSIGEETLAFLGAQQGAGGRPIFERAFLKALGAMRFSCDVDALPEGTLAFPYAPILRVRGPILQCQLLETALLNIVNAQTLFTTKAARIASAAEGDPVLEFGMRRAHSLEAAQWASRSAYIGGFASTSNIAAAVRYGIPVSGTHAHSWVMAFDDEQEAFARYAECLPNKCTLLVDTYDTLKGIQHAIAVGQQMKAQGASLFGIRIDSGDLAYYSQRARAMLHEAGLSHVHIIASGDLDEHLIQSLKQQKACITAWGIGTRFSTAFDHPSLGGVYKMSAIEKPNGWRPTLKVSSSNDKIGIPSCLQIRRFATEEGQFVCDMMYEEHKPLPKQITLLHPQDPSRQKRLNASKHPSQDLLVPVFRKGKCVYSTPAITDTRTYTAQQISALNTHVRRLINPHTYPVGLEQKLHKLRTKMIYQIRGVGE